MTGKILVQSPINYMGSKYVLLNELIPLFPKTRDLTFIDMFTGGGSVYMNVASMYNKLVANDILIDLIDIHRNLKNEEYVKRAADISILTKHDKNAYLKLRDAYNTTGDSRLLLSLIWSCNSNMMRFNRDLKFNQTHGKRCFNKNTERKLAALYKTNTENVEFTSMNFADVKVDEDCFVYLDPPYSNTSAGYNTLWSDEDESMLIEYCKTLISRGIYFGISGVVNGKENRVFDELSPLLHTVYFGDLYKKISKVDKTNKEYYMTNYVEQQPTAQTSDW